MRSAPMLLCLGLLVVAGPLLVSAQNAAVGVATADAQGEGDLFADTGVVGVADPDAAASGSVSVAVNEDQFAAGVAESVTVGDAGVAFTDTDATVNDNNAQSEAFSGSANLDGEPVVATGGAFANADADSSAAVTETAALTDPSFSASASGSVVLSDQPNGDGVDFVDGSGAALSAASGDGAQTGTLAVTDVDDGQVFSGSAGFAVSGRKLRLK